MQKTLDILKALALLTIAVSGAFMSVILYRNRTVDLNATVTNLNTLVARGSATLDAVNAPCGSFHGSATCGPLAQLSQTEKNFGIVAGQTALEVRQSGLIVTTAADNMNQIGVRVGAAVDQIGGTAKSATATIDAGRDYFVKKQPDFDLLLSHVDDITVSGNKSLQSFNAMLVDPKLGLIESNVANITGTGAHMLLTADQVETKLAQCTLHPHFSCYVKSDLITGAQVGGYLLPK